MGYLKVTKEVGKMKHGFCMRDREDRAPIACPVLAGEPRRPELARAG
jgi:hypothetical protein